MDVPLEAKALFFLLVAAQDDSGYYPWERMKVAHLVATCGWSTEQARQHAESLVQGGMAAWKDGGLVLRNGETMNGNPKSDRQPFLYQRQTLAASGGQVGDGGGQVADIEAERNR